LVGEIGELAEGGGAAAGNGANRVNGQARLLIKPSEEGDGFGKHYFEALQRDPDVVLAHAAVKKLLRKGVFLLN